MPGQLAPGYIAITGALPGTQSSPATLPPVFPPATIAVPDVTGLTEADATQTLQSLGFAVRPQTVQSRVGTAGNVLSQSPSAPTPSPPGTLVVIYVIQSIPATVDVTKRFDAIDTALTKIQNDTAAAIGAVRQDIVRDVTAALDGLRTSIKTDTADTITAARQGIVNDISSSVSNAQTAIASAITASQSAVIGAIQNPTTTTGQTPAQQTPAQSQSGAATKKSSGPA